EMHKVPVVDVQLLLDAGAARDPSGVPGLATFTATMLQQGAGARSALDVADEAAFLGAQLGTTATFDGASASIHVPKRRLEAGLGRAGRREGGGGPPGPPTPARRRGGGQHRVRARDTGGGGGGGAARPGGPGPPDPRGGGARGLEHSGGRQWEGKTYKRHCMR